MGFHGSPIDSTPLRPSISPMITQGSTISYVALLRRSILLEGPSRPRGCTQQPSEGKVEIGRQGRTRKRRVNNMIWHPHHGDKIWQGHHITVVAYQGRCDNIVNPREYEVYHPFTRIIKATHANSLQPIAQANRSPTNLPVLRSSHRNNRSSSSPFCTKHFPLPTSSCVQ